MRLRQKKGTAFSFQSPLEGTCSNGPRRPAETRLRFAGDARPACPHPNPSPKKERGLPTIDRIKNFRALAAQGSLEHAGDGPAQRPPIRSISQNYSEKKRTERETQRPVGQRVAEIARPRPVGRVVAFLQHLLLHGDPRHQLRLLGSEGCFRRPVTPSARLAPRP